MSLESLGSLDSPVNSEDRCDKENAGSNKKNYGKVKGVFSNMDACKDNRGNGDEDSKDAEVLNKVDVRNSFLGVVEVSFFMMMFIDLDVFNLNSVNSMSSLDNWGSSVERNT